MFTSDDWFQSKIISIVSIGNDSSRFFLPSFNSKLTAQCPGQLCAVEKGLSERVSNKNSAIAQALVWLFCFAVCPAVVV